MYRQSVADALTLHSTAGPIRGGAIGDLILMACIARFAGLFVAPFFDIVTHFLQKLCHFDTISIHFRYIFGIFACIYAK